MADDTVTVKGYDGNIALMGTDRDLVVVFHKGTKHNPLKSQQAGAPIFDQVDYVKIIKPGEPLEQYDQPVREIDKLRFRPQWEAYQKGAEQGISGTPLSVLFPDKPEIVMSFKAIHVHTVQQLANLTDTAKQSVMFGMNFSEMAKQYLSIADKGAEFHAMQARIDEMAHEIKMLREKEALAKEQPAPKQEGPDLAATVAALAARIEQLSAPPAPKRRGRPPKQTEQTAA